MTNKQKVYLGDSVYAEITNSQVVLTTNNGLGDSNIIVLEDEVIHALLQYLKLKVIGKND